MTESVNFQLSALLKRNKITTIIKYYVNIVFVFSVEIL